MRSRHHHDDEADAPVVEATPTVIRTTCCDCGARFQFNREFFASRALSEPRRCVSCREHRRQTRAAPVRIVGRVVTAHVDYCFLLAEDGTTKFFAHRSAVVPEHWPLQVNDRVTFEPAEAAADYGQARRLPRAFVVRAE